MFKRCKRCVKHSKIWFCCWMTEFLKRHMNCWIFIDMEKIWKKIGSPKLLSANDFYDSQWFLAYIPSTSLRCLMLEHSITITPENVFFIYNFYLIEVAQNNENGLYKGWPVKHIPAVKRSRQQMTNCSITKCSWLPSSRRNMSM